MATFSANGDFCGSFTLSNSSIHSHWLTFSCLLPFPLIQSLLLAYWSNYDLMRASLGLMQDIMPFEAVHQKQSLPSSNFKATLIKPRPSLREIMNLMRRIL